MKPGILAEITSEKVATYCDLAFGERVRVVDDQNTLIVVRRENGTKRFYVRPHHLKRLKKGA